MHLLSVCVQEVPIQNKERDVLPQLRLRPLTGCLWIGPQDQQHMRLHPACKTSHQREQVPTNCHFVAATRGLAACYSVKAQRHFQVTLKKWKVQLGDLHPVQCVEASKRPVHHSREAAEF